MKDKERKEKAFALINNLYENQRIKFLDTILVLENGNTLSGFTIFKSWNEEDFFLINTASRKEILRICFQYKIKESDLLNLVESYFSHSVLFSHFKCEYELQ